MKKLREKEALVKLLPAGKDYDPWTFYYSCPNCNAQTFADIFVCIPESKDIESYLIENFSISLEENLNLRNYNHVSFIIKRDAECQQCNLPIDGYILFHLSRPKTEEPIEFTFDLIDSESLDLTSKGFLKLGVDIYTKITLLFSRWWRRNYKIDVVIPFITREYFSIFEEFGEKILYYDKNLSYKNTDLKKNPFSKIIFRKYQKNDFKTIRLSDVVDTFYDSKEGEIYSYDILQSSLYQMINQPEHDSNGNLAQKYQSYFHAKFFAGSGPDNTELYLTSYNFGDIENLQFETSHIELIDSNVYKNDMEVFMNYHRTQIEKVF